MYQNRMVSMGGKVIDLLIHCIKKTTLMLHTITSTHIKHH